MGRGEVLKIMMSVNMFIFCPVIFFVCVLTFFSYTDVFFPSMEIHVRIVFASKLFSSFLNFGKENNLFNLFFILRYYPNDDNI